MRIIYVFCLLSIVFRIYGQNDQAFQLYSKNGKKIKYAKMVSSLSEQQVVLFGELHDNPIAHWMQLELAKSLSNMNPIVFGAEMIEADNQNELNQYLNGELDDKAFDSLARLWINHATDYAPLVELAKKNKTPFIATNVPRRYASQVYKKGLESLLDLSENEKKWMAPLPIQYDATLSQYQAMLEMMGGHGGENFPKAQAIKDATMAHFIFINLPENGVFLHFNGSFHSNYYEGIYWYLKSMDSNLKIATINTILVDDIHHVSKDEFETADFILAVDTDMTSTYK
jgi:uncharacterized iron-regulated protein